MMDARRPTPELDVQIEALTEKAGFSRPIRIEFRPGTANNRGALIRAGDGRAFLKLYFRHPGDPRDRLGAEFSFCRFAWDRGVRVVPRPLAADPANGMALYEFVAGWRPEPHELQRRMVEQALDFYSGLQRAKTHREAAKLPLA